MTGPAVQLGDAPGPLHPEASFRQAARAAMWPQVARILELEPALRDAEATDDLKRYRVATRRLRAALRVFDGALPKGAVKDIGPELRDLARAVGRVRDLDVRIAGLPEGGDLEPMREAWAAERAEAAADVAERLAAKRHARLIEDLARLVAGLDPEWTSKGRAVRDRAGSAIWAGFERMRTAANDLDLEDVAALHDLRIRAKRLRYTIEFLAPVLGEDRDWLLARLVALQDHLGELNDADLAAAAAREFLAKSAAALTEEQRAAIELYAAAQVGTVERLRRSTPKAVAPTIAAGFARRLATTILGPGEPTESRTS